MSSMLCVRIPAPNDGPFSHSFLVYNCLMFENAGNEQEDGQIFRTICLSNNSKDLN